MSSSPQVLGQQDQVLRRRIQRNEKLAHWGAWAVIAGLAVDVIIVWFERRPCGEKVAQIATDALIALGVLAELHFGRKAAENRDALERGAEERVATANRLAQEARERAALIEKTYAWRRVSRELRDRMVSAARQASQPLIVRIEYQSGDPEAHRLANDIGQAFSQAGVRNLSLTPNSYPLQPMYGLFAAHSSTLDVTRLIDACSDSGMPILLAAKDLTQPQLSVNALTPNLYLFVGMKPWRSSLESQADADDPQAPAY
jgi:hypothetical protein